LANFETGKIGPGGFSKAIGGFELASFLFRQMKKLLAQYS
jgi:hypothetical protein